jgi:DHA1 family tetracycline resistance protein-like MFS transporter
MKTTLPPLVVVLLIVMVDLMGFTLVMPLLPRYAERYHFTPTRIGWLLAAFPLCQLVSGPILGRLSDRFGRRPVLAVSQAGTAASFVLLGLSTDYTVLLLARALDGVSGGNILVAQAYVADVTKPEDRAKGLGLIGAAFGVGFVLGPLLGGLLLDLPVGEDWRLRVPFLVAAGFSTFAWVLVLAYLPESRPSAHARVLSWRGVVDVVSSPKIGLLVAVGAFNVLAFASLEGTFSLFLKERLDWSPKQAAFGFAFLGFVSAFVQGGLIRRLVPRFGEPRLILVGLATLALGLAALATVTTWPGLLGAAILVGVGQGVASPTILGLLSRLTPEGEQGAVFGTSTSAQTLARTINYVLANRLLGQLGPSAPFLEGAGFAFVALLMAIALVVGMVGLDPGRRGADAGAGGLSEAIGPTSVGPTGE